jgi:hypothetical protein
MRKLLTITGRSKDEVQWKVDEHLERNTNLIVKTAPMLIKDGRLGVGAKWIAVMTDKDVITS